MLRRLIILRHAKSSWASDAETDHARPLNKRGRRDAPRIAAELSQRGWIPEEVISSDAERTRQTWELMAGRLEAPHVRFSRSLYLGSIDEIREACGALDDAVTTAMVIGHNPGWEDAASTLCGQELALTTCNAALLTCDQGASWAEALDLDSCWTLEALLRPKELDD